MSERSDADALATAGNLTDAMTTLAGEVQRLRTSGKRTWKFVLFDIALTIGVAVFGFVAVQANTTATQNRNAALISCQATNVAREQNAQLWAYILTLVSPRPGETAAQKAQGEKVLTALRAKVTVTFAARDCEKLVKGKP